MMNPPPIEIQKYLKGLDYPASKEEILRRAEQAGADEELCNALEQLEEEEFESPISLSRALGQTH